jgi:protein-tyrosine phosphatase
MSTDVLFICTGNIFRSLTAEYALRRELGAPGASSRIVIASAGTDDFPHVVKPMVSDYLASLGLDVGAHCRRTLTEPIIREARLAIAMSTDHERFAFERFGMRIPVFTEACGLDAGPLLDVDEAVANFETDVEATTAHVRHIIDRILSLTPALARRIRAGELSGAAPR